MPSLKNINTNGRNNRRPTRNTRPTKRAEEIESSGEKIPGRRTPEFDHGSALYSPPQAYSTATYSSPQDFGWASLSPLYTNHTCTNVARNTTSARVSSKMRSAKKPQTDAKIRTGSNLSTSSNMASFSATNFMIYPWPQPVPTTFPNIPETYRNWKKAQDSEEAQAEMSDGFVDADDWSEFCGDADMYTGAGCEPWAMEYCVARTFVNLAKRAFRAGRSWNAFEYEERSVDSEEKAKALPDPVQRQLAMQLALRNDKRLAVFDAIKRRLCEEIWLEEYHYHPPAKVVRFAVGRGRSGKKKDGLDEVGPRMALRKDSGLIGSGTSPEEPQDTLFDTRTPDGNSTADFNKSKNGKFYPYGDHRTPIAAEMFGGEPDFDVSAEEGE